MTDDSKPSNVNDQQPDQAKLEQQQVLQSQASASAAAPPVRRATPGRRPLFRT